LVDHPLDSEFHKCDLANRGYYRIRKISYGKELNIKNWACTYLMRVVNKSIFEINKYFIYKIKIDYNVINLEIINICISKAVNIYRGANDISATYQWHFFDSMKLKSLHWTPMSQ
jgi:hypothetical protein